MKNLTLILSILILNSCLMPKTSSSLALTKEGLEEKVKDGKIDKVLPPKSSPPTTQPPIEELECDGDILTLIKRAGESSVHDEQEVCENKTKDTKYTVIMFTAEWCGYCKTLMADFEREGLEGDKNPNVKIYMQLDRRSSPENYKDYNVITDSTLPYTGYPTVYLFTTDSEGNVEKERVMDRSSLARRLAQ